MALLQVYFAQFVLFVLVLTRISGLIMTAPVFGTRSAPMRVRAFLALSLALIITPLQESAAFAPPQNLIQMLLMLGHELMLGLALGLAVMILFAGLQLTGQIIGQMSGTSLADVFDPTFNANIPVFTQLLDIIAISVFLAIGGHRHLIRALLDTFRARPPGMEAFPLSLAETLTKVLSESFVVGIRAAGPIMLALLMSMLILGLISRTLPQLNILVVGFSLNALMMLAVMSICLGSIITVVNGQAENVIEVVRTAIILDQPP
jgi:flagellar biosynthetic protein FliR